MAFVLMMCHRALFVKNLRYDLCDSIQMMQMLTSNSYNVTPEELFDLFGKFGPIRYVSVARVICLDSLLTSGSQIRQGIANNTKGTAFVVYEDVMDAKQACDKLNGFNFQNRYLVGTLHHISDISSARHITNT